MSIINSGPKGKNYSDHSSYSYSYSGIGPKERALREDFDFDFDFGVPFVRKGPWEFCSRPTDSFYTRNTIFAVTREARVKGF